MGQKIGQPGRVIDAGLAARHILDVFRARQHKRKIAVAEDVPDRLPVDSCLPPWLHTSTAPQPANRPRWKEPWWSSRREQAELRRFLPHCLYETLVIENKVYRCHAPKLGSSGERFIRSRILGSEPDDALALRPDLVPRHIKTLLCIIVPPVGDRGRK